MQTTFKTSKAGRWKRRLLRVTLLLVIVAVAVYGAFTITPWPSAMLIRYAFNKGGERTNEALKTHVPDGIAALLNKPYNSKDADALLDVYYPLSIHNTQKRLPVIVWIHGGGWIAGNKGHVRNYSKILADKGYVVVAVDYSIAPEKKYPVPLEQTNKALAYLMNHAEELHIDTAKIILAGDSGGAHIAAQSANIIADSSYARLIGIVPSVSRQQLTGLLLYCGAYDAGKVDLNGAFGHFLQTVLWSYSGKKDFMQDSYFKTASVINYVTANYPPCFISAGNDDPLLVHSELFSEKLASLNVAIDTLFYPADHQPGLPHEYQFNLDTDEGKLALERSVQFLKRLLVPAN